MATSRAPADWNWADGNLLVTMATDFGGFAVAATASNTTPGTVRLGSGPNGAAGKCISYLARCGIPKLWWMSTF